MVVGDFDCVCAMAMTIMIVMMTHKQHTHAFQGLMVMDCYSTRYLVVVWLNWVELGVAGFGGYLAHASIPLDAKRSPRQSLQAYHES